MCDIVNFIVVPKIRRCRRKTRKGSETSSADESSSSSESDEKEEPTPVTSRVIVNRKYHKRSIKDLQSPLELSASSPRLLTTQKSVPHIPSQFLHTPDQFPPTLSQVADQQSTQCSDSSSNSTSQVANSTRRARGYSLDSDQHSKSTESEEAVNTKEMSSTVTSSKMRNFASTPIIRHSK